MYQPPWENHILLYDMATSSSVLSFLRMKDLSVKVRNRANTEFMSTNYKMPLLVEQQSHEPRFGFGEIFWHVARKLNYIPSLLELTYMDWVESKFLEAEQYMCWCHEPTVRNYTYPRYTRDLPWPVSTVLFHQKRRRVQETVGSKFKSFEMFLEKFNQFLTQLNKRIGLRPYCLSDTSPCCVDALICGHTKAILNTSLNPKFTDAVTKQRKIAALTELIDKDFPS